MTTHFSSNAKNWDQSKTLLDNKALYTNSYGMNEMNKFPLMGMMRMEEACQDLLPTKKCLKLKKKGKCKRVAKKCKKTCELCHDPCGQGNGRLLLTPTNTHASWEVLWFPAANAKEFYKQGLLTLERGGWGGFSPPPEFGGSEKRKERETDNLLLIAPSESKS